MESKLLFFFISMFCFTILNGQSTGGKIQVNKRSSTVNTTIPNPEETQPRTNNQIPTNQGATPAYNRVKHENTIQDEQIELRYTAQKTGENSKNTFYTIIGHIYNNLGQQLYGHNPRIVQFQIDNWDSGFLNDNLQSIDGYATTDKLSNGSPLYAFGNDVVREFQFNFKTKRGKQPYIRAVIIKDWAEYEKYESYLRLEYTALTGTWEIENNTETTFNLQFSPQGEQVIMKDLYNQDVAWLRSENNTYIRQIGDPPVITTNNQKTNTNINSNSNSTSTNGNSSEYPQGGYLGNDKDNHNSSNNTSSNNNGNNSNQENNSNYPSGGYLGGNKTSDTENQQSNTNPPPGGYLGDQAESINDKIQAYSSAIQIIDRNTIKYANSEGITVILKKRAQ